MQALTILRTLIAAIRALAKHTTPTPAVMALLDDADRLCNAVESELQAGAAALRDRLEAEDQVPETPPETPPAADDVPVEPAEVPDGAATAAGAEATGTAAPLVSGDTPSSESEPS